MEIPKSFHRRYEVPEESQTLAFTVGIGVVDRDIFKKIIDRPAQPR